MKRFKKLLQIKNTRFQKQRLYRDCYLHHLLKQKKAFLFVKKHYLFLSVFFTMIKNFTVSTAISLRSSKKTFSETRHPKGKSARKCL